MKLYANFLALATFSSQIIGGASFVPSPKAFSIEGRTCPSTSSLASSYGPNSFGTDVASGPARTGVPPFGSVSSRGGTRGERRSNAREVIVQGGSLQTWSLTTSYIERVRVELGTEGRPLNANIELWNGPDNTPVTMDVYVEDGAMRPFNCVIETPRGNNAVAIRNTGNLEFPMAAYVEPDVEGTIENGQNMYDARTIQGGAIHTYPFEPSVASVQVLLRTDGRPLNARLELLQGPNNKKQVVELYTEDGLERPFYAVIETPGPGNVIRIVNTATMEYPLTASVEAFELSDGYDSNDSDDLIVLGPQY